MSDNNKNIQQQYEGFLSTPLLWSGAFYGLHQLELPSIATAIFEGKLSKNPRLGKRVESFVVAYLQLFNDISILQENIQIQKNKITIGEIDLILLQQLTNIHLEIIFKFYLYDDTVGSSELEHWIGPNRNDSLIQKIEKLSTKQLPLLYKEETQKFIHTDVYKMLQKVFFKAQLFIPLSKSKIVFEQLNSSCVCGFYIYQHELKQFKDSKFFIPQKMDWLLNPHKNVTWLSYDAFKEKTTLLLLTKKSPLCWIKQPNGEISKFFLVWWEA